MYVNVIGVNWRLCSTNDAYFTRSESISRQFVIIMSTLVLIYVLVCLANPGYSSVLNISYVQQEE